MAFRFKQKRLNHARALPGGDIYRAMRIQNRFLFILIFVVLLSGSGLFAVQMLKPVPVLLVDRDGRYIGRIEYPSAAPLSEAQLEALSKRFVQHYLSQNSATVYADAEIALAAMCPTLRRKTQTSWIEGGKLAAIVQRVQLSRVIFSEFKVLKYLNGDDIQVALVGKVLINDDLNPAGNLQTQANVFHLQLALRQVPLSARNHLGIEVCSVQFR